MDTPEDAHYFTSWRDGKQWRLVFSDEFEEEGRSFYPGDDPYWEAVDLHYWVRLGPCCRTSFILTVSQETNNIEWYDPAAVTTINGSLALTLSAKETHGLEYQGGKRSLLVPRNTETDASCSTRTDVVSWPVRSQC